MSAAVRSVARGLRFPEGPTLLDDGSIAVTEMQGESLTVVSADGVARVLGDCGGGPNGSALGSDGAVYVANNGGLSAAAQGYWQAPRQFDGCVQRVDADGTVTRVAADLPGPVPHRPNDICFGPDGTLYVSDSANWENFQGLRPGHVVAIGPDGTVRQALQVPAMPNGMAFAPDGRTLYLAQSLTRRVLTVPVTADGALGEPDGWVKLPGGMPDGLCVAADGRVVVCGSVGNVIHVFSPEGDIVQSIETPEGGQPTNCCLTPDGVLYVTLSVAGQLVSYDLGIGPAPVHRGAVQATGAPNALEVQA